MRCRSYRTSRPCDRALLWEVGESVDLVIVVGGGAQLVQRVGPDRLTRGNGLRELVRIEVEVMGHPGHPTELYRKEWVHRWGLVIGEARSQMWAGGASVMGGAREGGGRWR